MPRYSVQVEFDLETSISPEGVRFDEPDGVEDYEDSSYFQENPVECYGGSLGFTVEAEDEDAAESTARESVFDGMEVEDDSGITWSAVNVRVEIEEIVPPLTVETAKLLISTWLGEQDIPADVKEALQFLLARVA